MIIYKRKRPDSKVEHNFFLESCLNMAKCGFLSSKYYDFCKIFARKKGFVHFALGCFGCHSAKIGPQKIWVSSSSKKTYTHTSPFFHPKKTKPL
jgi:hypothetical protein